MYRDEYRLVPSDDDDDPCLAIEMVRHQVTTDSDAASGSGSDASPDAGAEGGHDTGPDIGVVETITDRIPLAGEIVPLNGHGYCASVTRCRPAAAGPNGRTRRVIWNEQLDEVFDNLETCRIAIENAFEPDDFLN